MLIEHAQDIGEQATYDQLAGRVHRLLPGSAGKVHADHAFADRARRRVVELQAGDARALRLWQLLVGDSMEYLRKIYTRLGITLTDADMAPESFYNSMLASVCTELEQAASP